MLLDCSCPYYQLRTPTAFWTGLASEAPSYKNWLNFCCRSTAFGIGFLIELYLPYLSCDSFPWRGTPPSLGSNRESKDGFATSLTSVTFHAPPTPAFLFSASQFAEFTSAISVVGIATVPKFGQSPTRCTVAAFEPFCSSRVVPFLFDQLAVLGSFYPEFG